MSFQKIVDCEIGAYVNVYRVNFRDTLGQSTCYRVPNTVVTYKIVVLLAFFSTQLKVQLQKVLLTNT